MIKLSFLSRSASRVSVPAQHHLQVNFSLTSALLPHWVVLIAIGALCRNKRDNEPSALKGVTITTSRGATYPVRDGLLALLGEGVREDSTETHADAQHVDRSVLTAL